MMASQPVSQLPDAPAGTPWSWSRPWPRVPSLRHDEGFLSTGEALANQGRYGSRYLADAECFVTDVFWGANRECRALLTVAWLAVQSAYPCILPSLPYTTHLCVERSICEPNIRGVGAPLERFPERPEKAFIATETFAPTLEGRWGGLVGRTR